jgi:hypothetical protein
MNRVTGVYDIALGPGLFSTLNYKIDDVVGVFKGTNINAEEYNRRKTAGLASHTIYVRQDLYLDCREQRYSGICKASLSNSPYYANKADGSQCIANCKCTISGPSDRKLVRLVATRPILAGEEIMWNYGANHQIVV